jgi:hypothetical protein
MYLRELHKYSTIALMWSWYSRNPDTSAFEENNF